MDVLLNIQTPFEHFACEYYCDSRYDFADNGHDARNISFPNLLYNTSDTTMRDHLSTFFLRETLTMFLILNILCRFFCRFPFQIKATEESSE